MVPLAIVRRFAAGQQIGVEVADQEIVLAGVTGSDSLAALPADETWNPRGGTHGDVNTCGKVAIAGDSLRLDWGAAITGFRRTAVDAMTIHRALPSTGWYDRA